MLARGIREIAQVYPRPTNRWLKLKACHSELYQQACELQLCIDDFDDIDDDRFELGAETLGYDLNEGEEEDELW